MTRAVHSGFSRAAVPRLMRVAPVPSARSTDASSRMPPDSSILTPLATSSAVTSASSDRVGPAPERRVEVDEVDPLRAALVPVERGGQRVAVARLGAGLALDQADGLAVGDVDGGQQLEAVGHAVVLRWVAGAGQGKDATQWASSWAPASPECSGWNWGAVRGPFSTAATNAVAVGRPRDHGDGRAASPRASRRAAGRCGRRGSARSRTRRRRGRRTASSPSARPSPSPCAARRRLEAVDDARPLPQARRHAAVLDPRRTSRACPTPIASTGAPAGEPTVDDLVAVHARAGRP